MKTKTTLAALLLAAVMVTPSYGADEAFLGGAERCLRHQKGDPSTLHWYESGSFEGYVKAAWQFRVVDTPDGVNLGQVADVVARYVYLHPEHRHLYNTELVKRACKEACLISTSTFLFLDNRL